MESFVFCFACVPGRSIFSNLHLVRDLIECCNFKNLPPAIISLDQEKMFDRVNWNFLDRVLQRMNFGPEFKQWIGPEFKQWIRVIYTNVSSACLYSGFVTSFFEISCGARQGFLPVICPGCGGAGGSY